jgi:DNA-binding response OmpR family regulator
MAGGNVLLIVEDDPDLLGLMSLVLTDAGFSVRTAANGAAALLAIAERMPDLILLDMKMPVMNGWEFAATFRDRYDHAAPIVVVTAAEDAAARAREIKADDWLGKPFNLEDLEAVVSRYLGGPGLKAA